MQRQRGELVPIGEVVGGLDGPVKAIRDASPQARHHFTVADQVNQLVAASEADPERGFMARTMALCSLPRTNPGNRKEYKRVNGPFTLYMVAGGGNKLPFGNLPRLILAWVSTEAVRTQSRVLVLGKSLSEFMRTLDIYSSSGRKHTRLRNQMKRLFGCTVTMIYEDENVDATVNAVIADSTVFWWNKPDQPSLWESKIELGEKFYNEIVNHPVPIEMNTLTALKRSTLGLDLYLWMVYRTFTLRAPLRLTWRLLYCQFGAHPDKASDNNTVQHFRYKVLRELKKIKMAWSGLNYSTARGVLILHPSTPGHRSGWTSPANQLISPFPGPQRPRQRLRRAGLDLFGPPHFSKRPERVNRWFSTGLCDSGSFPRPFGEHSQARSSTIRGTFPPRFFDHSGNIYK